MAGLFQRAGFFPAAYAAFALFIALFGAARAHFFDGLPAVALGGHGDFLFVQAALPAFKDVISILRTCGIIEIRLFNIMLPVLGVIPAIGTFGSSRKKNQRKQRERRQREQMFFHCA